MIQVKIFETILSKEMLENYINDFLKENDAHIKEIKDIKYNTRDYDKHNYDAYYTAMIIYEIKE